MQYVPQLTILRESRHPYLRVWQSSEESGDGHEKMMRHEALRIISVAHLGHLGTAQAQ